MQVAALPVQAPDHPVKLQPEDGVSVKVTLVPLAKLALVEPAAPSEIPDGLEVTEPEPTWLTLKTWVLVVVEMELVALVNAPDSVEPVPSPYVVPGYTPEYETVMVSPAESDGTVHDAVPELVQL